MAEAEARIFDLVGDLETLGEDGIPLLPGRTLVNAKELYRIIHAFPQAISDDVNDARIILKKKDEILQEAKMRAERIIQDAENERYKLLNESNLKKAMEEHAEKFRQSIIEECQQIKMAAVNEAQELKLSAKNEAIRMREESQEYAQRFLNHIEQDLDKLYQVIHTDQLRLQEMKASESVSQLDR